MKWKTRVLNLWLMSHGKAIMWSKIEFKNKFAEIAVLIFCELNDNTPVLFNFIIGTWSKPSEKNNMSCFAKIVDDWIQSTIFAKSSILDGSMISEYVWNYRLWIRLCFFLLVLSLSINKFQKQSFKVDVLKNCKLVSL